MKTKLLLMLLTIALVTAVGQANMLVNPDFEDGLYVIPDGWTDYWGTGSYNFVLETFGGHNGGKYMKIKPWYSGWEEGIWQTVTGVQEGEDYYFSVWSKTESGSTNAAQMRVEWYGADDSLKGTKIFNEDVTGDEWTFLDFGKLVAPEGAVVADVYLIAPFANYYDEIEHPICFDDVRMSPPDPNVIPGPDMVTWDATTLPMNASTLLDPPYAVTWSVEPAGATITATADPFKPDVTVTYPAGQLPQVAIENAGFETPDLDDATDDWTTQGEGWYYFANAGYIGPINPNDDGSDGYVDGIVPEGENCGWTNPSGAGEPGGFGQILTTKLQANTEYTLTVRVGNPDDSIWGGYAVQLLAGGTISEGIEHDDGYADQVNDDATVLAEDNDTLTIPEGSFVLSTVTFNSAGVNPALIGKRLQIRLLCLGKTGAGNEANFDDVKLEYNGAYTYTMTLDVNGIKNTMDIDVYKTVCQATIAAGKNDPSDIVGGDCKTTLADLAKLAESWLNDKKLTEAQPWTGSDGSDDSGEMAGGQ